MITATYPGLGSEFCNFCVQPQNEFKTIGNFFAGSSSEFSKLFVNK